MSADSSALVNGVLLCNSCTEIVQRTKPSGKAIAALLLGIVGLYCMFPLGIIGWVMAQQEAAAIDAGISPHSGAGLTKAAKVLGVMNLFLLAGSLLLLAGLGIAAWSRR